MITLEPIGIINSPYKQQHNMPVQPSGANEIRGSIQLKSQFVTGLSSLDGFSHIILIYHFHLSEGYSLNVKPFLDNKQHGVFATRAPKRPNSIGISTVKLLSIEEEIINIEGVDVIDGTPLLDIKPYIEAFDVINNTRSGWMTSSLEEIQKTRSDQRFV